MLVRAVHGLLALCLLISCKTSNPSASLAANDGSSGRFVGCVPSIGECAMSCPERNGRGQDPDPACQDEMHQVGCYCPSGEVGPALPEPAPGYAWVFQSCVMSSGECNYGANDPEQIYVGADPEKCPQSVEPPLACYHLQVAP